MISAVSPTVTTPHIEKPVSLSYLFRLQNLINQMTQQLGRLSEESHESMAKKKREYRKSSEEGATIHANTGWVGVYGAGACLGTKLTAGAITLLITQKYLPEIASKALPSMKFMEEQGIHAGTGLWTSLKGANEQRSSSLANLRLNEVQTEGNKSGDTVSLGQVLSGLGDALRQSLQKASG